MTDLSPTPNETDGSESTQYSEVVASLIDRLPPSQLGPGTAADAGLRQSLRVVLANLSDRDLFLPGQSMVDAGAAACCRAGLWLGCDFLEESHSISQGMETPSGSYWHGIMHRREPDPDNAKYWFHRVRRHPIFVPLAAAAAQYVNSQSASSPSESATPAAAAYLATQTVWDPARFVDLCERMRGTDSHGEQLCRTIARIEWRLLFNHCHRQALGLE